MFKMNTKGNKDHKIIQNCTKGNKDHTTTTVCHILYGINEYSRMVFNKNKTKYPKSSTHWSAASTQHISTQI